MRFMSFSLLATTAVLLMIPFIVTAHTNGASYEQVVGPYTIDIGYDPIAPYGGDRMVFDFGTFSRDGKAVGFDYVWVRIESNARTILATGIARAEFGPTSLLFALPNELEGEITVHARYQKAGDVLAEVEFPITVIQSEEERAKTRNRVLIGIVVAILAGVAGTVAGSIVYKQRS